MRAFIHAQNLSSRLGHEFLVKIRRRRNRLFHVLGASLLDAQRAHGLFVRHVASHLPSREFFRAHGVRSAKILQVRHHRSRQILFPAPSTRHQVSIDYFPPLGFDDGIRRQHHINTFKILLPHVDAIGVIHKNAQRPFLDARVDLLFPLHERRRRHHDERRRRSIALRHHLPDFTPLSHPRLFPRQQQRDALYRLPHSHLIRQYPTPRVRGLILNHPSKSLSLKSQQRSRQRARRLHRFNRRSTQKFLARHVQRRGFNRWFLGTRQRRE